MSWIRGEGIFVMSMFSLGPGHWWLLKCDRTWNVFVIMDMKNNGNGFVSGDAVDAILKVIRVNQQRI